MKRLFFLGAFFCVGTVIAQTDIPSTVTDLGNTWNTIEALGIVVLVVLWGRARLNNI
jgi:hypothetical protein